MLKWVQLFLRTQPVQNAKVEVGAGEGVQGSSTRPMCVRQVSLAVYPAHMYISLSVAHPKVEMAAGERVHTSSMCLAHKQRVSGVALCFSCNGKLVAA